MPDATRAFFTQLASTVVEINKEMPAYELNYQHHDSHCTIYWLDAAIEFDISLQTLSIGLQGKGFEHAGTQLFCAAISPHASDLAANQAVFWQAAGSSVVLDSAEVQRRAILWLVKFGKDQLANCSG